MEPLSRNRCLTEGCQIGENSRVCTCLQTIQNSCNKTKQKLTSGEERCLVDHILECDDLGFSPTESEIIMYANKVLEAQGGEQIIAVCSKGCSHVNFLF